MPYISVTTSAELTEEKSAALKAGLGEKIAILPNKTEAVTMVSLLGSQDMYFGGEKVPACLIDVRVYKQSAVEAKEEFTAAVIKFVNELLDIPEKYIYLNFFELDQWGSGGKLNY